LRDSLQKRCDLFIHNRDTIKSAFGWESAYMYPLCANIYSSKGLQADAAQMKKSREILKKRTSLFSNFRGTSKMAIISMLSVSTFPEQQMEQMLLAYNALKSVFWGSEYLSVAAAVLAEMADPNQYGKIAQRTRAIYNRMKKRHPFLTSGEDSTLAALLALSEMEDDFIEEEMERCYVALKPYFFSKDAIQSLSHVLTLGKIPVQDKCQKVVQLFNYLRNRGYKYGVSYELATLGVLTLLDVEIDVLAEEIIEVDNFLKNHKGFGVWGIGAKQRLMYAAMLVMSDYVPDARTIQIAALNGIISLVIAQQVAICVSLAAVSAAAATSAST